MRKKIKPLMDWPIDDLATWVLIGANLACAVWLWPSPIAGLNCFAVGWLLGNYAPEIRTMERVTEDEKK